MSPPAVGSVVPASTASISTSFGNVQWDQGGGGIECYGQTHATVSFEIGIVAPAGVSDPVPLIIEATGFAQVMGQPGSEQDITATASLSVRVFDEDDDVVSSETLGVARVNCSADAGDDPCDPVTPVTDTFDGMYTVFLDPDEYLRITQRAVGSLSGSIALWNPPAVGQYEAFVDPKIYIDPTYLIDVEGVPTPASSVYVLEVSPGFTVVPIPPALPLLASAIAWLALMRRRRDHA